MSTDRELLEAAAKAAGLWDYAENCIDIPWSPLTDDGDALRLAVKLAIDIRLFGSIRPPYSDEKPWVQTLVDRLGKAFSEPAEPDPAAATRRAIVRAAAALAGPTGEAKT